MAKGNYIALQALKPTELKVADYYKSFADDLIKRGDSDRAARAKMLEDQQKEIGSRFNNIKVEPVATIPALTDFMQTNFVDTARFIGQQRMMAEKDPKNAQLYLNLAENAANDHKSFATVVGSKQFIDDANAKSLGLQNNETFGTTDENARAAMAIRQVPMTKRNPQTGRMEFYLPKNENATDEEKLKAYSVGEIASIYTSKDQINLLRSNKSNGNNGFLDKQVYDVAKLMSDEYSRNYDGNRTNAKTWFSQERGNQWFDTNFGKWNPNNINPIVFQYAREINGRNPETEEDFNIAKQGIIGNIASLVGTETKVDTKETAADREEQAWRIRNAKKNYYKQDTPSRASSDNSGGGGMYNAGNQQVFIKDRIPNMTKDSKTGKMVQDGYKDVIRQAPMRVLSLPKIKGQPTTENVFGVTTYRNKKGEVQSAYYLGTPDKYGKIVTSRIDNNELNSYFVKIGYNPIVAKQYLFDETNGKIPFIGTQAPKVVSRPEAENLDIFFKTKESKDDDSGSGIQGL